MATVEFRDAVVWVNGDDRNGKLVYCKDRLLGVLVQLNDSDGAAGKWFLEAGFGPAGALDPPTFDRLDQAAGWIGERVDLSGRKLS